MVWGIGLNFLQRLNLYVLVLLGIPADKVRGARRAFVVQQLPLAGRNSLLALRHDLTGPNAAFVSQTLQHSRGIEEGRLGVRFDRGAREDRRQTECSYRD